MIVSDHGVLGRRSSPQGNDWSTTTQRGIAGAESTPLMRMSSPPRRYPKSDRPWRKRPAIARAYGSSSSLAALWRSPSWGA
jgi:hypothetical protein